MKATQPQPEEPAAPSLLLRLGRVSVAGVLIFAIWQTASGWRYLFRSTPPVVRRDPQAADRWDRLPIALMEPGNWRVLGSTWRAELHKTSANQPTDDTLHVREIPPELPPQTEEERGLVELLAQITTPAATADRAIFRRATKFTWGHVTAATTRVGETERLLEVVLTVGDKNGGYHVRAQPYQPKGQTHDATLQIEMPAGALCMATKFDAQHNPVCEIWMTKNSFESCREVWRKAGWTSESSPTSQNSTSYMVSRQGESICVLLPSGRTTGGHSNLIVLVRLSSSLSPGVAAR